MLTRPARHAGARFCRDLRGARRLAGLRLARQRWARVDRRHPVRAAADRQLAGQRPTWAAFRPTCRRSPPGRRSASPPGRSRRAGRCTSSSSGHEARQPDAGSADDPLGVRAATRWVVDRARYVALVPAGIEAVAERLAAGRHPTRAGLADAAALVAGRRPGSDQPLRPAPRRAQLLVLGHAALARGVRRAPCSTATGRWRRPFAARSSAASRSPTRPTWRRHGAAPPSCCAASTTSPSHCLPSARRRCARSGAGCSTRARELLGLPGCGAIGRRRRSCSAWQLASRRFATSRRTTDSRCPSTSGPSCWCPISMARSADSAGARPETLTMFADYKVPQVLQQLGVLAYSTELEAALRSGELSPTATRARSRFGRRACRPSSSLRRCWPSAAAPWPPYEIDWRLWSLGQELRR